MAGSSDIRSPAREPIGDETSCDYLRILSAVMYPTVHRECLFEFGKTSIVGEQGTYVRTILQNIENHPFLKQKRKKCSSLRLVPSKLRPK